MPIVIIVEAVFPTSASPTKQGNKPKQWESTDRRGEQTPLPLELKVMQTVFAALEVGSGWMVQRRNLLLVDGSVVSFASALSSTNFPPSCSAKCKPNEMTINRTEYHPTFPCPTLTLPLFPVLRCVHTHHAQYNPHRRPRFRRSLRMCSDLAGNLLPTPLVPNSVAQSHALVPHLLLAFLHGGGDGGGRRLWTRASESHYYNEFFVEIEEVNERSKV